MLQSVRGRQFVCSAKVVRFLNCPLVEVPLHWLLQYTMILTITIMKSQCYDHSLPGVVFSDF